MSMPPPIAQANLGMADSLILMVLALVVFGPRRLPQIGRQIGKLMYEFRKASNEFKWQMEEELRTAEESDRRKQLALDAQRTAAAPLAEDPAPAQTSEPRILPPSTGAPVEASRPGSDVAVAEPQPAPAEEPQSKKDPAPEESASVTEQAAHHG